MDRFLDFGEAAKWVIMTLGALAVAAWGVWLLVHGEWFGLGVLLVGVPLWYLVADIATGLVLLPIVGIMALLGRRSEQDV